MGIETERKFLVKGNSWRQGVRGFLYRQGYLSAGSECEIRVRIVGENAFLTIKGRPVGASRLEYEYSIPVVDANEILDNLCDSFIVEKTRYRIEHKGMTWEVDEFHGANDGLILAELEMEHQLEHVELPEWVGQEVTADTRYFNVNLAKHPFTRWSEQPRIESA